MEVEPLGETQLEDLGLNTCSHDLSLSYREVPSFNEQEPQPNLLPSCPSLDVSLGYESGLESPIKPHSPDSFRTEVVDHLTIHTPPLPHVASFHLKDVYFYYHLCLDDPKKHYGFKPETDKISALHKIRSQKAIQSLETASQITVTASGCQRDDVRNIGDGIRSSRLRNPKEDSAWDPSGSNNEILINALDAGNPLYLQTNDNNSGSLINTKLNGSENYRSAYVSSVPLTNQWERCNVVVLSWLLSSISEDLYLSQVYSENANKVWKELKETYDKINGEFDILTKLTPCSCDAKAELEKHNQLMKLIQFLMGLDKVYQPIRSSLLTQTELPNVKDAFVIVCTEESHRGLGSASGVQKPRVSSFVSRIVNNNNRSQNRNNNRFGNNNGTNRTRIGSSNNVEVQKMSGSLPFTNDQIAKLMSLIGAKGNSGVHVNMAGIGTIAKIRHVGNLRLASNVVLFDVLVIPEYTVSLLYVNKMIKDIKLHVGCNEYDCVIHDLKKETVLGTGSESGGLYMFDVDWEVIMDHQSIDIEEEQPLDCGHTTSSMDDNPIFKGNVSGFQNVPTYDSNNRQRIVYTKSSSDYVSAYADSDWAKCKMTRRSISGYCIFVFGGLVSWKSKKQATLSRLSTEAEYRSMASSTREVMWIVKILKANPVMHEKTKHFDVDVHLIREKVSSRLIKTIKVDSESQIANILTKGLGTILAKGRFPQAAIKDSYSVRVWLNFQRKMFTFLGRQAIQVVEEANDGSNE
ncbi:ribonuclease H-like domain-containing protein [Tanacetum coccineum]